MMGSIEDPKDGGKVAATVFGAVIVYAVRISSLLQPSLDLGLVWERGADVLRDV